MTSSTASSEHHSSVRTSMQGRPGLLRTVLEAQETRGLTRSDDISRLLPSEAANMARGRRVRQSKLLFFAKVSYSSAHIPL